MGEANPIVLVIDDDPEFRDSIVRLLRTVGLEPGNFRLFSIFSRLIRRPAAFSAPAGVPNPLIRLEPDLEKRGLCPGVVSKRSLSTTNRSSN